MDIIKVSTEEARQCLLAYLPIASPDRAVLGKQVMEAVWEDMACTQLPTWITSIPQDWGTALRGKLSADKWRVICIIHLTITLIRLWGNESGRKKELLENFMDLISAVCIANLRVSLQNQIHAYDDHIFRYVNKLKRLYPGENLRPIHHAALHIGKILDFFRTCPFT